MLTDFSKIRLLFDEINNNVKEKIIIYVIGGAAMMNMNLKRATKDIDIVVETKQEYKELEQILEKIGFKTKRPLPSYKNLNLARILIRDDFQIDIFEKTVCAKFMLSVGMIKRSKNIFANKLFVNIISKEDIFLFKTMTERDGDLDDCVSLARENMDWKAILSELKNQIKESGEDIWVTWIMERMDILEDRGVFIPIIDDIRTLSEEYYVSLENKNHKTRK